MQPRIKSQKQSVASEVYLCRTNKQLKVLRQDFDILKSDTPIQDRFKNPSHVP